MLFVPRWGFERVCGILLEQGYQIPGAKQKINEKKI